MADRDGELAAALARGRSAWPGVRQLPADSFGTYLDERVPPETDRTTLPIEDLYLACACVAGDPVALQAFEDTYIREVAIAAAKLRAAPGVLDESRQVVRDLLFVGRAGGRPAIASYAGRGDLRGWVRVIAMREVMRLCERDSREVTTGDEQLLDALSPATDPELEQMKERYREDFAAAFHEAVLGLSPRERTLLRHQVIDGLGVEAIGRLYHVHHSTAARWLVRAREALLEGTRDRLAEMLRLSPDEVTSVLRLIRSRLDVSVERLLKK
jgi:RNA polymerase sigma-70 factor (ECF subfamily)